MADARWQSASWHAIIAELHREQSDPAAWSEADRRLREAVRHEAIRLECRLDEIDDLVAEVLIRLATPGASLPTSLAQLGSVRAQEVYLATSVRNALLTLFRRKTVERRGLQTLAHYLNSAGSPPLFGVEDLAQLNQEIHRLGTEERTLLRLKFWEELSIAEIASRLNLTYSNVAVKLHRLFAKLRGLL
jgi:RNA polymerase sigma factor (sigma-70 family)